jgi:hypothetical protein
MSLSPGDRIPLTDDERAALGSQLVSLCEESETQHAAYFADIATWWDFYEAKPQFKQKSSPWPGASNIVVPFIRSQADPLAARAILSVFSTDKFWWGSTQNKDWKERLPHVFAYLNLTATRGLSLFNALDPGVLEQYVIGEVHWGQTWSTETRHVMLPGSKKPRAVVVRTGPDIYHRPRENWLYQRDKTISQSEYVIEQAPMTWTDLCRQSVGDEKHTWSKDAINKIKDQRGIYGPSQVVRAAKRQQMGLPAEDVGSPTSLYDIRQATLDWPFFTSLDRGKLSSVSRPTHIFDTPIGDAVHTQIKVIFHRISGEILHAIYDPYLLPEKPFYGAAYRRRASAAGGSVGIGKLGEHFQRGLSTHINQGFDAVTMANSIKLVTSNREFAARHWAPNTIPFIGDIEQLKELASQKNILPDVQIMNLLQAMGERTIGQADPNLGRETRMGGHPQPATNFLGIMEQSQINNSRPMKHLRMALSAAGSDRALMAQLFERNDGDWIQSHFDEDDAEHILAYLEGDDPIYGQVNFDVYALSEIHNPDAERQQAILIDQITTNYFITVAKFAETMVNPQVPPDIKTVMAEAIKAKTAALRRFLESSDVDDVETYLSQLGANQNANIELLARAQAALGQPPIQPGQPAGMDAGAGADPTATPGLTSLPGGAGGAPAPSARVRGAGLLSQ